MRPTPLLALLAALTAGCGDAPALASLTSAATESPQLSSSTGADENTATAAPSDSDTGTDTTPTSSSAQPDTTGEPSTGPGDPVLPPTLREASLTPTLIVVEGPIAAHALAMHADGVRMQIDAGLPIELAEVAPGEFTAEIGIFTALSNGTHEVVFTAWQGETESEPVPLHYEAALKPAGGEAFWDASGVLGAGFGRSVAVDPAKGWVYEAGDYIQDDQHRCFVRRRGAQGEYLDADIVEVLPGKPCTATAITVAADGTLHVLAEAELNGKQVWWLGRKDSWDAPMLNLAWGAPGEQAHALAQRPGAAEIAVCGTMPTNNLDTTDGLVTIFRKDAPGYKVAPFDYRPTPDDLPHRFGETLRDCAYSGDVLVLAGEMNGRHSDDITKLRDRLLLVEYDTLEDAAQWTVAGVGPGVAVQSGARSLAITDSDTYLTYGFACEDACKPQLHLREFMPGGVPSGWNVLPPVSATLATDIVWSPAGYAIISAGKVNGPWWTEFWSQGWIPGQELPVWSYSHLDQPNLHAALAIAVAKFGRIYIAGIAGQGDLEVPAFAIVDP